MIHSTISAAFAFLPVVLTLQECYVCKSGNVIGHTELEFQFPGQHIEVCQRGVMPQTKQCPPKFKGCLTQYNDEYVMRSCSDLGLTTCQKANHVEYCYCQGNLCNVDEKFDSKGPTLPLDDEDEDSEGSGSTETTPHRWTTRATQRTPFLSATNPTRKIASRGKLQHSRLSLIFLALTIFLHLRDP